MGTPSRPQSVTDYHIACICPMGVESAPVEAMLDEFHESPPDLDRGHNAYTLGRLGLHNIVITMMPKTGTNATAAVVTQLRADFPAIEFGLLIGIGGGVPGELDVRLGDVVVSQPNGTSSGVIQYDLGKRIKDDGFQRTGSLNEPPPVLCASVRKLDAQHRRQGHQLDHLVAQMLKQNPHMKPSYMRPAAARDQLFQSSYSHHGGLTCDACDTRYTVERSQRDHQGPYVHYGTIGSANVVVKDAILRDELQRSMGLICVEMEAAGLMNNFPCLVIRGICDYADSHKNKQWQSYGAAVAAAYMKELLLIVPVRRPFEIRRQPSLSGKDRQRHSIVGRSLRAEQLSLPVIPIDSFDWVWSTAIKQWLTSSLPYFWITGKPGSGKSTLMQHLAEAQKTRNLLRETEQQYKILQFYFDYRAGGATANTQLGLLKLFLSQLCDHDTDVESQLKCHNESESIQEAGLSKLLDLLRVCLENRPWRACAFIDGLDEFQGDFNELAQFLSRVQSHTSMKLCIASRPEPAFTRAFKQYPKLVMQQYNHASIRTYIDDAVSRAQDRGDDSAAIIDDATRDEIMIRAEGVIIWARLAVDELLRVSRDDPRKEAVALVLEQLPPDLEDMYDRAIVRIEERNKPKAGLVLFFLNGLGGKADLEVLHGLCDFFGFSSPCADLDLFLTWLKGVLGSFVDIVDSRRVGYRPGAVGSFLETLDPPVMVYQPAASARSPETSSFHDPFWCDVPESLKIEIITITQIRLIHKTLQTYLQRPIFSRSFLSKEITDIYSTDIRSRLYANVISAATNSTCFDAAGLESACRRLAGRSDMSHIIRIQCKTQLQKILKADTWRCRLTLLAECILRFPMVVQEQNSPTEETFRIWEEALRSPLMVLELAGHQDKGMKIASLIFSEYHDCFDLRLAVEYCLPSYLEYALQEDEPAAAIFNKLITEFIYLLWLGERNSEYERLGLSSIELIAAKMAQRCDAISIHLLFFILVNLATCRLSRAKFDRCARATALILRHIQRLPIQDANECGWYCTNHPLQFWARLRGTYCTGPVWSSEREDILEHLVIQLLQKQDALSQPPCGRCGTALHDLVNVDRRDSPWRMRRDVGKLIVLAKLGANPNIQVHGRTPLQQLRSARRKLYLTPTLDFRSRSTQLRVQGIMAGILEHHRSHGTWPDFTMIAEKYTLEGPAFWTISANEDSPSDEATRNDSVLRQQQKLNAPDKHEDRKSGDVDDIDTCMSQETPPPANDEPSNPHVRDVKRSTWRYQPRVCRWMESHRKSYGLDRY